MNSTFKARFFRLSKWFAGLFVLLFVLRLGYGYYEVDTTNIIDYTNNFFSSVTNLRKNYASEKFEYKKNFEVQQEAAIASNQKYEKTASVKSKTSHFDQDEKRIRQLSQRYAAIIQYEQNTGKRGSRELHLSIGVNPISFDTFYVEVQKIGVIRAKEITKVDKTNEYRQLNAKKASLEKTLLSLNELKSRGGQITDFVSLHDKILDIESKLQELGVELGNFDTENEFCTVQLSLYEGITEKTISLSHRIKVALEWTIQYFALLMFAFVCMVTCIFILLLIIDKMKILQTIVNKVEE